MSKNLTYEGFVRGAFSINSSTLIERGADPQHLADADIFDLSYKHQNYFDKAKEGVRYSIESYNNQIFSTVSVSDNDRNSMENLYTRTLSAINSDDLYNIILEYKHLRELYFRFPWQ